MNNNNNHHSQLDLCCLGLYNWNDQVNLVCLQAESFDEIDFINVTILSGDETIQVVYKNKYVESFDPEAMNREIDLFDGQYIVYGHEIEKWLDVGIEIENRELGILYPHSYSRKKTFIAWQEERNR